MRKDRSPPYSGLGVIHGLPASRSRHEATIVTRQSICGMEIHVTWNDRRLHGRYFQRVRLSTSSQLPKSDLSHLERNISKNSNPRKYHRSSNFCLSPEFPRFNFRVENCVEFESSTLKQTVWRSVLHFRCPWITTHKGYVYHRSFYKVSFQEVTGSRYACFCFWRNRFASRTSRSRIVSPDFSNCSNSKPVSQGSITARLLSARLPALPTAS